MGLNKVKKIIWGKKKIKKTICAVGGAASGAGIGGYIGAGTGIAIAGTALAATLPFAVGGGLIGAGIAYAPADNVCDEDHPIKKRR